MRFRLVLAGALLAAALPVSACGPFLYDNADLDQFSLIDPGILNTADWNAFLAYSSPAFGQTPLPQGVTHSVIHIHRLSETTEEVSNLIYDYGPGEDPLSVAANEQWWLDYFKSVRRRTVSAVELSGILYEGSRPVWLNADDRAYLDQLSYPADDRQALVFSLAQARNETLPEPLRHRYVFWAVRAFAQRGDARAVSLFEEFCPGPAPDLPLARAQGWAASMSEPAQALNLWLDLFVRWPALRVQTFSSLSMLDPGQWEGMTSPAALVAKFFLDGRDFSPETLSALAQAEHDAGGNGSWTESVYFAMAEQIEAESGVFALFGLVDPSEQLPQGLFTDLIDRAEALAGGVQPATRTWWLLTSYLCLFDGDTVRASEFLAKALAVPALNRAQDSQADLLGTLLLMNDEKDRDWSAELQTRVVKALDWGKTLNLRGRNRGLYHSVAVLAAQKYLARGQRVQAALAYGLVQNGAWSNPYRVQSDDGFWAVGWPPNNGVNLLMDALMTDEDLALWSTLLKAKGLAPLTAKLVAQPFLTERDLQWWQAHRELRRGDAQKALALFTKLGGDGSANTKLFPPRKFGYSLDLDPLEPGSGRAMKAVSPLALATIMARVQATAQTAPTGKNLLALGEFWFSLQLSGTPLLFANPPPVISFVNGNYEYYGYDGADVNRDFSVGSSFPLDGAEDAPARMEYFYREEFTALARARRAFEAVLAKADSRDAEYRALLFLQAIDGDRGDSLTDSRYDGLPLAEEFRSTCEWFS